MYAYQFLMRAAGADCSDHPSTLYSKCHSDMLVHIEFICHNLGVWDKWKPSTLMQRAKILIIYWSTQNIDNTVIDDLFQKMSGLWKDDLDILLLQYQIILACTDGVPICHVNRFFPSWLSCFSLEANTWSELVMTDNVNTSIFSVWMRETKRVCSLSQKITDSTMNLKSWVNVLRSVKVTERELWNIFCSSV